MIGFGMSVHTRVKGMSVHTRGKVSEYTSVHELEQSVRSWSICFNHPYSPGERAGDSL